VAKSLGTLWAVKVGREKTKRITSKFYETLELAGSPRSELCAEGYLHPLIYEKKTYGAL